MFAVPGWAVSAKSLRTQTIDSEHQFRGHKRVKAPDEGGKSEGIEVNSTGRNKKRKGADSVKGNSALTEANFALLWRRHMEGAVGIEGDVDQSAKKKKKKKRRKGGNDTEHPRDDAAQDKATSSAPPPSTTTQPSTVRVPNNEIPGQEVTEKTEKKGLKNFNEKPQPYQEARELLNDAVVDDSHLDSAKSMENDDAVTRISLGGTSKSTIASTVVQKDSSQKSTKADIEKSDGKPKRNKKDNQADQREPHAKGNGRHVPEMNERSRDATIPRSKSDSTHGHQSPEQKAPLLSYPDSTSRRNEHPRTLSTSLASDSHFQASSTSKLTPLQQKMRAKLTSARFRHLNETLYTSPSSKAQEIFEQNPDLFVEYHLGFSQQVMQWPENPVDGYVAKIKLAVPSRSHGKLRSKPTESSKVMLPRTKGGCTIADLGCGEASLAQSLFSSKRALLVRVLSFDFRKSNNHVTEADITKLPLDDRSIDVAIFCLSLMGTNWIDCIEEAWRVVKFGGECWISEVKSRFGRVKKANKERGDASKKSKLKKRPANDDDDGDDEGQMLEDHESAKTDETDISAFVDVVQRRGFMLKPDSVDKTNKMFVRMEFVKSASPTKGRWAGADQARAADAGGTWKPKKPKAKFIDEDDVDVDLEARVLKPCVYKIR